LSAPAGLRAGRLVTAAALACVVLLTSACSDDKGSSPVWQGGTPAAGAAAPPVEAGPKIDAALTTPQPDAKDVPVSTEVAFAANTTKDAKLEVVDSSGKAVKGELLQDGKTWMPAGQLKWGATYTAKISGTNDKGESATTTTTFTTMAKPDQQVRVSSFLGDGSVAGVGMPLIVRFSRAIPEKYRADVQRRMTVRATPQQEGIWHWWSPTEVRYRPKVYWKPNTKIFYKLQTGGLPMGDGWYGSSDLTVDMKIARSLVMTVDNQAKKLTVTEGGDVVKTIPVSLGKPKTPSSSGTMVVMEKKRKTVFDTRAELGAEGYRTDIDYAQRITHGGEFIHAAPWSEGQQGRTNVSHGCVNISMANAAWLFNRTMVGDPITVKGTETRLKNGNGWSDWNMSWDDYVKGSAIPPGQ
jgi:lipoprotein-anchoring transpeptidase ErfK/SrfK